MLPNKLGTLLSEIYAVRAERILYLSADSDVQYESLAAIIDVTQNLEFPGSVPEPWVAIITPTTSRGWDSDRGATTHSSTPRLGPVGSFPITERLVGPPRYARQVERLGSTTCPYRKFGMARGPPTCFGGRPSANEFSSDYSGAARSSIRSLHHAIRHLLMCDRTCYSTSPHISVDSPRGWLLPCPT
jgi:hypothetical protein